MSDNEDTEYLIMTQKLGEHPMKILAFDDEGTWRAVLRCDLCIRHTVFVEIDPRSNDSMTMLYAEMQMHASGIGDRMDDGWHDGLGFTEVDD